MHESHLLLDAILYLTAAVVFVPLASRLKLGSVLGYLLAGCAIGPFGLRLVQDVESIRAFSEFGVVMMLFVIGLELEPTRLVAMRKSVFGGGSLQMAACGLALAGGGALAGLPISGAIVAGLALALSSTAIAVQTMNERGLMRSPMGHSAFAVLLFQDIAAIPLVGIVPMLGASSASSGGGVGVVKVVFAIVGVVVVGRYALQPLLRLVAGTGLREVFTAFSLLLVLGIAFFMEQAGVSMALGAFLSGVLLAGSEYRHALETDIEPFKGLLLGLFFISVGMSIDFGLLAQHPLLVAGLVLGFVFLKTFVLFVIAPRIGVPADGRIRFACLLSQGGEFAFVVFGVAKTASVLPGHWDKLLTLVVALSMAATPLLMIAADAYTARLHAAALREADTIEADDAPVIIAGFGRFGQIVGRLLFASGLRATILDSDPDQIDLLRRFGFRIFYGDPTRLDLLHAAGAGQAKVLVNTIDDVESSLRLVDLARLHFPNLQIIARARNVTHYFALRERGVTAIERELFESSLAAGRRALQMLGVGAHEAKERADRFRRHNVESLEETRGKSSQEERIAATKQAREQLELAFQKDLAALERTDVHDWHGGEASEG